MMYCGLQFCVYVCAAVNSMWRSVGGSLRIGSIINAGCRWQHIVSSVVYVGRIPLHRSCYHLARVTAWNWRQVSGRMKVEESSLKYISWSRCFVLTLRVCVCEGNRWSKCCCLWLVCWQWLPLVCSVTNSLPRSDIMWQWPWPCLLINLDLVVALIRPVQAYGVCCLLNVSQLRKMHFMWLCVSVGALLLCLNTDLHCLVYLFEELLF